MSNGLNKKKKTQKTQDPATLATERLYASVCDNYGFRFNAKLKQPEYSNLLLALSKSHTETDTVNRILKEEGTPANARLSEIFPLTTVPRRKYLICGVIGAHSFYEAEVVLMPDGNDVVSIISPSMGAIQEDRQALCCVIIVSESELPYDMRKWPRSVAAAYMKYIHKNVKDVKVKEITRSKALLNSGVDTPEQIVRIRLINPNPSKKQLAKAEHERQEHIRRQHSTIGLESDAHPAGPEVGFKSFAGAILNAEEGNLPILTNIPDLPVKKKLQVAGVEVLEVLEEYLDGEGYDDYHDDEDEDDDEDEPE